MKQETKQPTPFLEWQQELSDMFEPEKVAHILRPERMEPEIEKPTETEAGKDGEKEDAP